jgi:hypothetical protein
MSDSIKVVLIFYSGFILSMIIGNILWNLVVKTVERRQKPKIG